MSYERLVNGMNLPEGAERTVKILLLVEELPYENVKEIVEKGRTVKRIVLFAKAIERGYPIDFLLEYDDPGTDDMLESIMVAIEHDVPLWLIRKMRTCSLEPASVRRITAAYAKGIPHESLQLAIKPQMDNHQVGIIVDALSLYNTYEEVEVIADPQLDWFQMKTILQLYVQGLTVNEAKAITSPYANCKMLIEMGQTIIYNRPEANADENSGH